MRIRTLIVPVAAACLLATAPAHAATGDYGKNDGGGFRNVLPPGENGLDTQAQFLNYLKTGAFPPHWADQQPLYENLLYASPTLTDSQIGTYFKDASFGVKSSDVESVVKPRKGVKIIRDAGFGVPHIYGKSRGDTMFGAGYASAADRLFLMDVLRHTGRADLSNFLGGANVSADASQWQFAPYTEADLEKQLKQPAHVGKKEWKGLRSDVKEYVAGINAYIAAARTDANLMPGEYALLGAELKDWKQTDVVATASLFGGIFGRGGGSEVTSGVIYRALAQKFGTKQGRKIWAGFRDKNDPAAPVTIPKSFPYMTTDSFAKKGLAIPDSGSVTPAQVVSSSASLAGAREPSFGDQLLDERLDGHHSNWELLTAKNSKTKHPLGVLGPQVGYYLPQVLMELDLHGPDIDARGAAFPGVSMYVQLGHGRDYAWSATSAGSDNTDQFAEVLCGGDQFHYRYKGKCRSMQKLVRDLSWKPNAADPTPAGQATLTSYRTVHGIVNSYGTVDGKKVAFVTARTTYMHEPDSVVGFRRFNQPSVVTGTKGFGKAASGIQFTFNWAYTDSKHTAYYLSGAYPKRAKGTSPDFPVMGTGKYDWVGYDPKTYSEDLLGSGKHPKTVDQPVMVSWNNKPAKDWASADDQWGYGSIYRSQMIEEKLRAVVAKRKAKLSDVVTAMDEAATQDIRGVKVLPLLLRVLGKQSDPQVAAGMKTLRDWRSAGSHRRDLNRDGVYEHNEAVELMDAWWPLLINGQFQPVLGEKAYTAIQEMIGLGSTGTRPRAPSFSDGWWSYSYEDLKSLIKGKPVKGGFDRVFCGDGKMAACRTGLADSLKAALAVTPQQTYGFGACTNDPQPSCWDKNRPRITAAINKPGAFPFQNRPTFQQAVSVKKSVKR